jgi:tRNA A-37 threonylcarbamoyl transferase component Bud32
MSYIIPHEVLASSGRVFMHSHGGRAVVVKQHVKHDIIFVHVFQNALARLLREPMLLCVDARNVSENQEIKKLKELRASGLSVPKILYEAPEYFILEYVGKNLEEVLAGTPDAEGKNALIAGALEKLRALHEKNFIHGGSQIKNFTWLDGEIYMLDFEAVIPRGYDESFRMRDILLFVMSLENAGISTDLEWICNVYDRRQGFEVYRQLERTILKYKFLKFLDSKLFSLIRMNDVRAALSLIDKVERIQRECQPEPRTY